MRSRIVLGARGDRHLAYWCDACGRQHAPRIHADDTGSGGGVWSWNGSFARPTLSPNVDVNAALDPAFGARCDHFVLDGRLEYLAASTHAMAGRNVEMSLLSRST